MSGYVFHPGAYSDLVEIWDYIAENNIDAADRRIEHIHSTLQGLALFPRQGHQRLDLSNHLLFQPTGTYLIAYAPDEEPLLVIGILHGRRNPRALAAMLRDR